MKRKEFRPEELTEKAFDVYSNSDFEFYTEKDEYFVAYNANDTHPQKLGTIDDVESFLLQFVDEEE